MRKRKERAKAEIETGSFSDISFLLIIFFVLTTTLSQTVGRKIDVPAAPPQQQQQKDTNKVPVIRILDDKITYSEADDVDGKEITFPELKVALQKLEFPTKKENERCVMVEASENAEWDRYFKVITLVTSVGGVPAIEEEEEKK